MADKIDRDKLVREFLAEIGGKGGRSKSAKKKKAILKNLAKANATRLKRKEKPDDNV